MSDTVVFIENNPQEIIDQMTLQYEALSGNSLQPGHLENLLIHAFAYRESLIREQANEAAVLNLLRFSKAPYIDFIGERVGVQRLASSAATVNLKLTFTTGHGDLIIPAGIRIQPVSGTVVFTTDEELLIDSSVDEIFVSATCTTIGAIGNGFAINEIVVILDPQPYLFSAQNIEVSAGGADQEDDESLRERIRLAPSTFSTAGPDDAYVYFAKTANPGIGDVKVTSLQPGDVNIYPLMKDGSIPNQTVLDQVFDACNAKKRRPINDTVIVTAPTEINYAIDVELTLITGQVASDAITQVNAALQNYSDQRNSALGLDIVRSKITGLSKIDGIVYDVNVIAPAANVQVDFSQVAKCTGINVSVGGYSDE